MNRISRNIALADSCLIRRLQLEATLKVANSIGINFASSDTSSESIYQKQQQLSVLIIFTAMIKLQRSHSF